MNAVGFREESFAVSAELNYVEKPILVYTDEEMANEVIDQAVELFKTENSDIYGRAYRIQEMYNSRSKFQALRTLIDESTPWILVVPNEVNQQPQCVMITKRFTISLTHDEHTSWISETAIAKLRRLNRAQVTILTVSEDANRAINNLTREISETKPLLWNQYTSYKPKSKLTLCWERTFDKKYGSLGWVSRHQRAIGCLSCIGCVGATVGIFYGVILPYIFAHSNTAPAPY